MSNSRICRIFHGLFIGIWSLWLFGILCEAILYIATDSELPGTFWMRACGLAYVGVGLIGALSSSRYPRFSYFILLLVSGLSVGSAALMSLGLLYGMPIVVFCISCVIPLLVCTETFCIYRKTRTLI
jgi:hypothetical protein